MGTKDSMSREIKWKTQIISWGKIGKSLSIQIEIIWSGRIVKEAEKGIYEWILFRQKKKHKTWTLLPGRAIHWIPPFLLKSIQIEMIIHELWNITGYIWKQKEETHAKSLPHGSYETELQLSLILCQTIV